MILIKKRSDYYQQLNNEYKGNSACQSTAIIQSLDLLGYRNLFRKDFIQPEDSLKHFIDNDPEVLSLYKRSHGVSGANTADIPPSEWADCIEFGTNKWLGKSIIRFNGFLPLSQIISEIESNRPVVVSMKYTNIAGHYITVAGINNQILYILDPYKNTLRGTPDGYLNEYTVDEFLAHYKGYGFIFE
jgi:hypothetical protein